MSAYMNVIEKRLGKNVANKRMTDTFAPQLIGARIGSENYTSIMDAERERIKLLEKTSRFVDSVVDKLLHDDEDDDTSQRGFIGEIVDKIKSKIPNKQKRKTDDTSKKSDE